MPKTTTRTRQARPDSCLELLHFAEDMKIPSTYLPNDLKCLFKNADQAEMWKHLMSVIKPAHKIEEIRKNILRSKILKFKSGNDSPKELRLWQHKNNTLNKLEYVTTLYSEAQEDLSTLLSKAKAQDIESDNKKKIIKFNKVKTNIYKKKSEQLLIEIADTKDHKRKLESILLKNSSSMLNDINTTMQDLCMQAEYLISKQDERTEILDEKIKEVVHKFGKNILWDWFVHNEKRTLSNVITLTENVQMKHHNLVDAGKTMQVNITSLSAENLKTNIKIMKNIRAIKHYHDNYNIFVNNLETKNKVQEMIFLDHASKKFFLSTKIRAMAELVNKMSKSCNEFTDYEQRNLELLNKIVSIDIGMRKTIENIEHFDYALYNTPTKVLNVCGKNCDIISNFHQYIKNNTGMASCCQDLQELELFKKMNISQIRFISRDETKQFGYFLLDTPIYHDKRYSKIQSIYLQPAVWKSKIAFILEFIKKIKSFIYYKQKNSISYNEYIPEVESKTINSCDFSNKIENVHKLQIEIRHKLKDAHDLIEFWTKNPLKNHISIDRLFDGKPYKYYEELLQEYKEIL